MANLSQTATGGSGFKTDKDQSKKVQLPGEYKSKDYYGFDEYSYFDIEKEMVKHRMPQPSSLPKIEYAQTTPSIKKK